MGRRVQFEVDTLGEGQDQKRIEVMGDRIKWREILLVLYNTTIMEVICKTTQIWPILNCWPSRGKGWRGREVKKLELKVLGSTVE